jgi:hypothetical protein
MRGNSAGPFFGAGHAAAGGAATAHHPVVVGIAITPSFESSLRRDVAGWGKNPSRGAHTVAPAILTPVLR